MPDNYPTPGQFPAVETTHGQCALCVEMVTHMQGWVSVLESGEKPGQSLLIIRSFKIGIRSWLGSLTFFETVIKIEKI